MIPAPEQQQPEFHYHYPQEVSPAPRAHAPVVLLLLMLLVTVVMGLVMLFVVPIRYGRAWTKAAQEANSAAWVCGRCAQELLDEMDEDGVLKTGKYILSTVPGKEEKNVPPAMKGLQETFDKRLRETADTVYPYLVVVEDKTVTYAAVAVSDKYIGTYPESASYGMIAYGKKDPVSRSEFKDLDTLYEYTFGAVFTPAKYKES